MLIQREEALILIDAGKAGNKSFVWPDSVDHDLTQPEYVAIDRYDIQRVDHYAPSVEDLEIWVKCEDLNGE